MYLFFDIIKIIVLGVGYMFLYSIVMFFSMSFCLANDVDKQDELHQQERISMKYRKFAQNKLVRDKIMSIIGAYGSKFDWKTLDDAEFLEQLKLKLMEEAAEVCSAQTQEAIIEELADVLEVMIAWCQLLGCSLDDVILAQRKKFEKRGGYQDRKYVISAEHVQGSPCEQYCLAEPEKYPEIT